MQHGMFKCSICGDDGGDCDDGRALSEGLSSGVDVKEKEEFILRFCVGFFAHGSILTEGRICWNINSRALEPPFSYPFV